MTRLALLTLCALAPAVAWADSTPYCDQVPVGLLAVCNNRDSPAWIHESHSVTPPVIKYAPGYPNGYIDGNGGSYCEVNRADGAGGTTSNCPTATTTTVRTMPDLAAQLRAKARALDAAADVLEGK